MPLLPGSELGPYKILAPLGAGGMGEVYRGVDGRLDREVAVKVLPASVVPDSERLARFEREAKVVANLNHPNIAQVYGVEQNGNTRAIIMELVAGSTLQVPQPLETALRYARQIADALEAAHEKGIIHRDLKPANIMVTPDEVVKILDFGLATAPAREDTADPSNSPTFTMAATQAGIIMGTAGYMSPEQAAGKPVDRRSDIWSFGVVLWEMLTGARLFEGETASHTIADVLRAPIDFGKLPSSTPPPITELVKRCLDRNVKTRLQSIAEARIAIDKYLQDPAGAPVAVAEKKARASRWSAYPWLVAVALAGLLAWVGYRHINTPPPKLVMASILPPDNASFVMDSPPALSPDGKMLAFAVVQDGRTALWVRDLGSLSARMLPGTANATYPFWSPDSQSIGFVADGKLKRIDLVGGAALALCPTEANVYGASWSPQGVILFPSSATAPLSIVPATGGKPVPVTTLDHAGGEISHRHPWFLPDGRTYLYTVRNREPSKSAVYVGKLDSTERTKLLQGPYQAMYVASLNTVLYATGGNELGSLMAQTLASTRVSGNPSLLVELLAKVPSVWASHLFTVAADGTLAYFAVTGSDGTQLTWFDRSGKVLGTVGSPDAGVIDVVLSPDGTQVATSRNRSGSRDIWVHELTRGTSARVTFNDATSSSASPAWWADGKSLLYWQRGQAAGRLGIVKKTLASSRPPELIGAWEGRSLGHLQISKDGRYLIARLDPGAGTTGSDVSFLRLDQPGQKPQPYLQSLANEGHPAISPDGRWLAYSSDESRRTEVYVQSFPEPGQKHQVSVDGGTMPAWSRDGKELFFIGPDRKMMAVSVAEQRGSLSVGQPTALFQTKIIPGNYSRFDVSSDGRFLIPVQETESAAALTLLLNWQTKLAK